MGFSLLFLNSLLAWSSSHCDMQVADAFELALLLNKVKACELTEGGSYLDFKFQVNQGDPTQRTSEENERLAQGKMRLCVKQIQRAVRGRFSCSVARSHVDFYQVSQGVVVMKCQPSQSSYSGEKKGAKR